MRASVTALALVLGLGATAVQGQNLTIYANNNPPMQFVDDNGTVKGGMSVEIVRELQRRIGDTSPIQGVPWARGYEAVQRLPNVLLFSTARTAEREKLVQWVGPMFITKAILITAKKEHIKLTSLDDARKLNSIGTIYNEVRGQILQAAGFTNLDFVTDHVLNLKKLATGRIQAMTSTNFAFYPVIKEAGMDPADFEVGLVFSETPVYIAFSLATPAETVQTWAKALKALDDEGVLDRIVGAYAPR